MISVTRHQQNPILKPDPLSPWQSLAVFNGCPVDLFSTVGLVYRAVSVPQPHAGVTLPLSTIGYAEAQDGIGFSHTRQLITPELDWERYGCEDPRITKLGDRYYIFYTALSTFPFRPEGIRVGVATSRDLLTIDEKHLVTPFNAKAMALFPDLIGEEMAAVLTVNTDRPPAKICVAKFAEPKDLWSEAFWSRWYASLDSHVIPLLRSASDQVEVGAPPILTADGWLLIYCYITNYTTPHPTFAIDAVLLDRNEPRSVIGTLDAPLLFPKEPYEKEGHVPNVIFPSGTLVRDDTLTIYYGASDTTLCAATTSLAGLLSEFKKPSAIKRVSHMGSVLKRFAENPILEKDPSRPWEAKATFNPGALFIDGRVHIFYRALSSDDTSVLGYAASRDGLHIDERLPDPAYVPREPFEQKRASGYSGCEDPRLTFIDGRVHIFYTAYSGEGVPRVATSSIARRDFLAHQWTWEKPVLISPPGIDDKNACILSKKIQGKYVLLHRFGTCIWVDWVDALLFSPDHWLSGTVLLEPRSTSWDSDKVGIGGPPIETGAGWLLVYHGLSQTDHRYRLGAALLAPDAPLRVIGRLDNPILEPEMDYENTGVRPGTVFACGNVVIGKTLYVYYGGADQVCAVATISLDRLLSAFK